MILVRIVRIVRVDVINRRRLDWHFRMRVPDELGVILLLFVVFEIRFLVNEGDIECRRNRNISPEENKLQPLAEAYSSHSTAGRRYAFHLNNATYPYTV